MQRPARHLTFSLLEGAFAVARLAPDAVEPSWARRGEFSSVTRTGQELSVVCEEAAVPPAVRAQGGWRCLKVLGPFDFSETGVADSFIGPLAAAALSVFLISTFDTDYLLVRASDLDRVLATLRAAGHQIA